MAGRNVAPEDVIETLIRHCGYSPWSITEVGAALIKPNGQGVVVVPIGVDSLDEVTVKAILPAAILKEFWKHCPVLP